MNRVSDDVLSAPAPLSPRQTTLGLPYRCRRPGRHTALSEGHLRDRCDGLFAELHLLVRGNLLAQTAHGVVHCCLQPLKEKPKHLVGRLQTRPFPDLKSEDQGEGLLSPTPAARPQRLSDFRASVLINERGSLECDSRNSTSWLMAMI